MNNAISTSTRSFPLKPLTAAVLLMYATGVQSAPVFNNLPDDGFINEHISIDQSVENLTTVTQTNNRDVINWREFSILEGETVRFFQPGADAIILNRVTGESTSNIFGALQANGRVFLINPNGIVFGANAQISVNGLVASTLDLKPGFQGSNGNNDDIELRLDRDAASIINEGAITANDIVLIAPTIINNGILNGTATENGLSGTVQLIAASEVTVDTSGDNLAFKVPVGYEDALISQLGTVMAEGGRVLLMARPTSDSSSSVINVAGVNQAARISIDGNTVRLSGNINSGNGTGTLEVTADNITQTAAVNVDNATLNATDSVALGDFNAAGMLTVDAENSITLDNLTANRLVMTADSISQNADKTVVVSDTTSLTARNVTLGNAGNSFADQITLNVAGQATLESDTDLAVQGEVGSATLTANNVVFGDLTTAGDLIATAQGSVAQVANSTLTVGGATTLNATDVTLDNADNSFAQPVNLSVTDKTNLRGTGRLEVEGSVVDATLQAQNLVLGNVAVGGDLTLKANTINQTTDLVVQGTTRIENAGLVNLDLSNDFVGDVTLAGSTSTNAAVNLTDRNDIDVGGQAGAVNITANQPGAGAVTLRNLRTQTLEVNANTVRNANTDNFDGSVDVSRATRLTASNVEMANVRNNFGGQVNLQVDGQATLTAANNLSVHGNAGNANLNADSIQFEQAFTVGGNLSMEASSVTQDAALAVEGLTRINNTASANLIHEGNDFGSTVELGNTGRVALADRNSIAVLGNVGTLEVGTVNGVTTLGELTADTLVVNADRIAQNARVVVNNESTLNASHVDLNDFANDFGGKVTLNAGVQADLLDANSLQVAGSSNVTNLEAQTLVIDGLTSQGAATLTADVIRQEGAFIANGETKLNGGDVNLNTSSNNIFAGKVNVSLSGDANIRSSNNLEVSGTAATVNATATNTLTAATLSAQDITLSGEQVNLQNFMAAGDLTLNGGTINQEGALTVEGTTTLGASNVLLDQQPNDFKGDVVLNNTGAVALQDANSIRVQGTSGTLNLSATGDVEQSGALNVGSTSTMTAANINLNNDENRFGGEVAVQATGTATVHASNNLQLSGNANTLTANASGDVEFGATAVDALVANAGGQIKQAQSTAVVVENATSLIADSVVLNNSSNDFKDVLSLNVAGQATVRDQNNLQVQGNAQSLVATATNATLTLGALEDLEIGTGTLTASTIELNQLKVSNAARLQADTITQTEASNTGGKLTLAAPTVDLIQTGNDFQGELLLEGVQAATIHDANRLSIGGAAETLSASAVESLTFTDLVAGTLTADAKQINQTTEAGNEVRVTGGTNLIAESVDLQNSNNDFAGAVNLQVSGQAQLRDANTLTLHGKAGQLNINAQQVNQRADTSLTVANTTTLNAGNVNLSESGNDFQGDVVLNVSGNATVHDANTLNVAGQVNGATTLVAQSIEQANQQSSIQANELRTASTLKLRADNINLSHAENQFNGVVQLENATQATVVSQGNLTVAGSNLENVDLTAEDVMLNELGSIQQLMVTADEVKQGAALLVEGQTTLSANKIELNNAGNDFIDTVVVQARSASNPDVQIRDKNSLAVRGENLALAAEVQGDLTVQANNLALGRSIVGGITNINLTGALTQTNSVTLNGSQLTAGRIVLNNSANRFNGITQLDSDQLIELRTAGDFTADTGSSTGALALNIGGNTNLQGEQVELAQSRFGGNLTVNANQISQSTGAIEVDGNTQLAALGGTIDLQNENNQFNGNVSANAEQTSIATNGDLRLLNLTSRGGEITADGRLLLLGNIEQTGGTLTFTARGIPRPLSSAELALMLPPSLDVFSNKEAVNPITGFGRLDVSSAVIDQQAGQISTAASATTVFNSTRNGSINLTRLNQIGGRFSALSGPAHKQAFVYSPNRGTGLFAVNNDVRLQVGENGIEADLVAIRSRGLSTQGPNAVIHARMPYNDIAVGTSRSFPGLTLSIPLSNSTGTQSGAAPFGESGNSGQSTGAGAIRVELGDPSRAGLGGFLTVLPFEGSNLLPGQVVYLAGPERPGTQAFFYDGARSLDRIPVVYNGSLLLSPQENAALTTAQGAVVLAREEQTRSVVRTENVAGRVINGVVVEVGPGRPATEGEGGAGKPASCDAAESGLECNP